MAIEYTPSAITLPNITVEEVLQDGVLIGHRLTANDGYVIYNTNANDVEYDPDTLEEIPVINYFRQATIPVRVPVENWSWVVVLETTVPADRIFGGGDNQEVM